MRIVFALAQIAIAASQGPDAREISPVSEANEQNWKIARNFTLSSSAPRSAGWMPGSGSEVEEVKPMILPCCRDRHT
jgi:hypothetical protein